MHQRWNKVLSYSLRANPLLKRTFLSVSQSKRFQWNIKENTWKQKEDTIALRCYAVVSWNVLCRSVELAHGFQPQQWEDSSTLSTSEEVCRMNVYWVEPSLRTHNCVAPQTFGILFLSSSIFLDVTLKFLVLTYIDKCSS